MHERGIDICHETARFNGSFPDNRDPGVTRHRRRLLDTEFCKDYVLHCVINII